MYSDVVVHRYEQSVFQCCWFLHIFAPVAWVCSMFIEYFIVNMWYETFVLG
jgi:hypothetical protein